MTFLLASLFRAVFRVVDVLVLPGRLRQAYLVAWRGLPNPYTAARSSGRRDDDNFIYGEPKQQPAMKQPRLRWNA